MHTVGTDYISEVTSTLCCFHSFYDEKLQRLQKECVFLAFSFFPCFTYFRSFQKLKNESFYRNIASCCFYQIFVKQIVTAWRFYLRFLKNALVPLYARLPRNHSSSKTFFCIFFRAEVFLRKLVPWKHHQ